MACSAYKPPVSMASSSRSTTLRIAVLPVENLSRKHAPLKEIWRSLVQGAVRRGVSVLEEEDLNRFMARHRVRYVGGIDTVTAQAAKDELGIDAILVSTLELYDTVFPPKIALAVRLVSAEERPRILWIKSVALAGDDSRGILGLGLITDPRTLQEKALDNIVSSLAEFLAGKQFKENGGTGENRFRANVTYSSLVMSSGRTYTIAVLPFINRSERRNAGEIMALHFVRQLAEQEDIDVIEPGVVRQKLLNFRIIMPDGPSSSDLDAVFETLDVDFILTGKVRDYQNHEGSWGTPKADFTVSVFERRSNKLVWTSQSHNQGDEGVFFFDWGKISTAEVLASKMVKNVVRNMTAK